jgi:regulatory protein
MYELTNKNQQFEKAYGYAIYLLSLKLRTEGELREKLRIKSRGAGSRSAGNHEAEITDKVIAQLKENHYLNDENYAQVYLDNLKKYKTFGYYGIKKKLMEKRLPLEIIESVLSEGLGEEEEMKIAKRFLNKQTETDKQKLFQKLKAKGFRSEVIFSLKLSQNQ